MNGLRLPIPDCRLRIAIGPFTNEHVTAFKTQHQKHPADGMRDKIIDRLATNTITTLKGGPEIQTSLRKRYNPDTLIVPPFESGGTDTLVISTWDFEVEDLTKFDEKRRKIILKSVNAWRQDIITRVQAVWREGSPTNQDLPVEMLQETASKLSSTLRP